PRDCTRGSVLARRAGSDVSSRSTNPGADAPLPRATQPSGLLADGSRRSVARDPPPTPAHTNVRTDLTAYWSTGQTSAYANGNHLLGAASAIQPCSGCDDEVVDGSLFHDAP